MGDTTINKILQIKDDALIKYNDFLEKQRLRDVKKTENRKIDDEERLKYNEKMRTYYRDNKQNIAPKCPYNIKINLYVSALNSGKIKKINLKKLDEYHISFNEMLKKYQVDKEFIKQFHLKNIKK